MYDYRSNAVFSAKDYLDNYRRGNYSPLFDRKKGEMFLKTLPRLVREDSNIDMYAYAVMLYNFGDIQGKYKSLSIIEKLVDQHFVPAYNAYGIILYDGICINKNAASAAKWFDKAAFNGFEIGKYNYAICLLKGDGVPRDVDRAMRLIKESSDAGYNKAQHAMGIAYYKGENGFTKDVYTAFDYFKLAADNGNLKAQYLIGNMYLDGEACTKSMDKAIEYLRLAAEWGNTSAQAQLGDIFYFGKDVSKDTYNAHRYWLMAAENGDARAMFNVGSMIYCQEVYTVNPSSGLDWVRKAAAAGNKSAKDFLKKI